MYRVLKLNMTYFKVPDGQLKLTSKSKLYIPSTINIDLILWHPQLTVDAFKC